MKPLPFRSDVGSFLDSDLIERAIETGCRERAPLNSTAYWAFTDPSGGSHDSFTLAIGHHEGERLVLDVLRGITPPFDPSAVVKELCAVLKSYRCDRVTGDHYAGEWVVEAFSKEGVTYRHSERNKSELYLEALPLFAQGYVDLLDMPRLTMELLQLERRTARSGRDSVDHPPAGHDDHANAACGVLALLAREASRPKFDITCGQAGDKEALERRSAAATVAGALWHMSTLEHDALLSATDKERRQTRIVELLDQDLGKALSIVNELDRQDIAYLEMDFMEAEANKSQSPLTGHIQEDVSEERQIHNETFHQLWMVGDEVADMLKMLDADVR